MMRIDEFMITHAGCAKFEIVKTCPLIGGGHFINRWYLFQRTHHRLTKTVDVAL